MAEVTSCAENPKPAAYPPSRHRTYLVTAASSVSIFLLLAVLYGPRARTFFEDPLTGRVKVERTWMGWTFYNEIAENDVSLWADRHGLPGISPVQCGWLGTSSESSEWFSGTMCACGGFAIPHRIYHGHIAIPELTREQTLQKYQAEVIGCFGDQDATWAVQTKWNAKEVRR